MTDVTTQHDHDGPHEGPIKTPKQLILAVFFAFLIPIAIIVLLTEYVGSHARPNAGSDLLTPTATAERIAPIGMVEVKDASDPATMKTGEQVFAAQCTTCHTPGMLGAPKLGDTAAWAPRVPSGYAALLQSAVHGKGNMSPQGGGDFTDFEIGRAVVYMANKGGAHFDEPKAPAPGAAPAADTSAVATAGAGTPAAPASAAIPAIPAVAVAGAAVTTATKESAASGGAVPALYSQLCQTCHAVGVAGAPKLGDKTAWAPRLAQGIDGLTASAIKGKGAMPPRGGSNAPDAEIRAVVTYFVNNAK
jgi:cytochrome c5